MLRSHIEWQQKTLLFVIYTSGFQQPCQRSLLPHGTTLISLSPIANGIIIDISYQCFCQIYVRYSSSCNHFVIMNQTAIREVSLQGCTCSLKLSWYLWQQIPWCISDSYSHKQTGSELSLLTLHDTDLEQFGTNWWYQSSATVKGNLLISLICAATGNHVEIHSQCLWRGCDVCENATRITCCEVHCQYWCLRS